MAHRHITFKKTNYKKINKSFIKYHSFVLVNIPITTLMTWLLEMIFSKIFLAKIISDILYFIFGYYLSKKIIFN